jgi:hypothetical protein
MPRSAIAVVACLSLAACADSHKMTRPSGTSAATLQRSARIYVSIPRDGAYGSKVYARSGEMTTDIIVAALLRRGAQAERGARFDAMPEALEAARSRGAAYLLFPTIIAWEDRATEWSGKSDVAEVKIDLVEVQTGKVLDTVIISSKGKWLTFGGLHPQDLLPDPVRGYVEALLP